MATAFPRAIIYDRTKECHVTVLVRRDKGFIKYMCADHGVNDNYPMRYMDDLRRELAALPNTQVVCWVEVTDNGD